MKLIVSGFSSGYVFGLTTTDYSLHDGVSKEDKFKL